VYERSVAQIVSVSISVRAECSTDRVSFNKCASGV